MSEVVDKVKAATARAKAEGHDVSEEIATVERRMALRRDQMRRHAEEAKLEAQRKARPLPLIGVVAAAVVGFLVARMMRPSRNPLRDAYVHAYRPVMARGWGEPRVEVVRPRRASALGTMAAVTGAALRIGMSPQARILWNAIQRRRHARHA